MANAPFIIPPSSISPEAIKADLLTWLEAQPNFAQYSTFYASTNARAFIDMVAGVMAFLKYDSMTARREAFIQFAQNRSSIIAEAQFLGYNAFRGRNAVLSITFVPLASGVLNLWTDIGFVKALSMLVLTPKAYTVGVPCTVSVLIGEVKSQELIAPNENLNAFRYTTPLVSDDIRMYIDGTEVATSDTVSDLLTGKFSVLSNPIGSIDVKYLNDGAVKYAAGSIIRLDWVELNNLNFSLSDVALDPTLGNLTAVSVSDFYRTVEATTSIQVNAPLENETKNAIRGRNDMRKIYKKLNTNFVDANGIDITAAVIKVVGLETPNYERLTATEKTAAVAAFTPYRMNGLQPPLIGDPSEINLRLSIKLYLNTAVSGDVAALVAATLAPYLNILKPTLNLFDIENTLSLADFVRIARVSVEGQVYALQSFYSRGDIISPPTATGFLYRCLGFRTLSAATEPVWPTVAGDAVNDGNLIWTAVTATDTSGLNVWQAGFSYVLNSSVKKTGAANGLAYIVTGIRHRSGTTEPVWPVVSGQNPIATRVGTKTIDNELTWVAVPLTGTPDTWSASTSYAVGDLVVSTDPTTQHTTGLMFQVFNTRGKSGAVVPTFPTGVHQTVTDGQLVWESFEASGEIFQADEDEYLTITPDVVTV